MTPMTTMGMEPPIRQRFWFAVSSFARMYTPPRVTPQMEAFCYEWALSKENAPLGCLHQVDLYFRELWKSHN